MQTTHGVKGRNNTLRLDGFVNNLQESVKKKEKGRLFNETQNLFTATLGLLNTVNDRFKGVDRLNNLL
jgi:hypothetical protein